MKIKPGSKIPTSHKRKRPAPVHVDIASLLLIDHVCNGCGKHERCCCATYEVCVTHAEMDRIIEVLPAAARLCPHLKYGKG